MDDSLAIKTNKVNSSHRSLTTENENTCNQEKQSKQNIADMASMSMAASLLSANLTKNGAATSKRGLMVAGKASSKETEAETMNLAVKAKEESSSSNGRRELVFAAAAAAAAASSIAKVSMADEPKPGTPEARKKYAPICVTMPTARICRK